VQLVLACLLLLLGSVAVFAEDLGRSTRGGHHAIRRHDRTFAGRPTASAASSPAVAPLTAISNPDIDPVMLRAGSIAEQRALPHSTMRCWRYVKEALVAAGSVSSYPQTVFAKQAGDELVRNYGFVKLAVESPDRAPVGSVIVYGGGGPGHVELRTATGFVSDFFHAQPSNMPFIGAYARVERRQGEVNTAQVASWSGPGI
jgi:hypothetical protein